MRIKRKKSAIEEMMTKTISTPFALVGVWCILYFATTTLENFILEAFLATLDIWNERPRGLT